MDFSNNTTPINTASDQRTNTLEAAVVRALERSPQVPIPQDFAARMAARVASEPQRRRSPWAGFGPRIALVSSALLTGTLFAFAAHATPSLLDLRFDLELVLLVELGLVGYVLTRVGLRE